MLVCWILDASLKRETTVGHSIKYTKSLYNEEYVIKIGRFTTVSKMRYLFRAACHVAVRSENTMVKKEIDSFCASSLGVAAE